MGALPFKQTKMNYTISNTRRNLMILSAAFLTVFTIYIAFFFLSIKPGITATNTTTFIIRDLLFAIPHVYLLFVLFDYFRHQGWKVLQYILLFTAIFEIITKAFNILNEVSSLLTNRFYYSITVTFVMAIAMIMQAVFLLQIKRKDYPEVFSLQKYAIGLILLQIIAIGIPALLKSDNSSYMMLAIRIISAIPYLFLIDFTLKLKSKEMVLTGD